MKEIILVKNGELALKGLNRSSFEDKLVKNIKHRISDLGDFEYTKSQSTIMVEPLDDDIDLDEAADRISRVFGIAAFHARVNVKRILKILKIKLAIIFMMNFQALKLLRSKLNARIKNSL